jgi:hypothetical protein
MSIKSFGGFDGPLLDTPRKIRRSQVDNRWRARFKELLEENNTTATLREGDSLFSGILQNRTAKTAKTPSNAEHLGVIAMWSIEFGYVSLHDPTTGEWYDIRTKEAPSWAMREASKRKELYKDGNRKAYRLTSREMEKLWVKEHPDDPLDDDGATDERGYVYEDYLEA